MPSDKRKPKRPKAMRVTTEASTTKLPRPRRKAQEAEASQGVATQAVSKLRANRRKKETWAEGYAKWEAKRERVRCPHCEKLVPAGPHDIHTCYDAKALREPTPSPIAGQPLDGIGSAPAPEVRAIPCGEDGPGMMWHVSPEVFERFKVKDYAEMYQTRTAQLVGREGNFYDVRVPPPDTSAYPWGLKFAWWLDGVPTRVRRWLAARLTRLAEWVTP